VVIRGYNAHVAQNKYDSGGSMNGRTAVTTIVVLFNLKPGVSPDRYEAWARSTDLPIVRGLPAVHTFEVQRATGMLSGSPDVPYRYVEILRVASVEALRTNIAATPAMAEVARQFREFADAPQFIVTEAI
jgi:hypothetical protein